MFIGILLVTILISSLIGMIICEKVKTKDKNSNILLGVEISIIGLALISIAAPNKDNLFFYIEWFGFVVLILGVFIVLNFHKSES